MIQPARKSDWDDDSYAKVVVGLLLLASVAYFLVAWPVLASSTLHGRPTLMRPGAAVSGAKQWIDSGLAAAPDHLRAWHDYRDLLPSPTLWLILDLALVFGVVAIATIVWAQIDHWRGRRWVARRPWDPRGDLEPRSWAEPRDLVHLQPRRGSPTSPAKRLLTGAERAVYRERRAPEPAGGDSWPLGRLRGRELRSAPDLHLIVVAPTRAGKTTRVVIPAACEHRGPAVVLTNKIDVVTETRSPPRAVRTDLAVRAHDRDRGPADVWLDSAARLRGLGPRAADGSLDVRRRSRGSGGV